VIVAAAVGLALLIQAFVVKPFQIPSGSMKPTLEINQRVLANRVNYRFTEPGIGDVVIFRPPMGVQRGGRCGVRREPGQACPRATPEAATESPPFIKRIVAGPGDTLSVRNGHPVVNEVEAEEDFVNPCGGGAACDLPEEIVIPPGEYFMMGDNRGASEDSRFWGPVPRERIIGQALLTYWPPDRIGPL